MNTTQYATASHAILAVTDPADRFGTKICLATGTKALSEGDQDVASAMLDEAAHRAGIISSEQFRHLHRARLAGSRS
jgi:hypothetical protein